MPVERKSSGRNKLLPPSPYTFILRPDPHLYGMSRPSLLEAPCYSEEFSDTPDVQVVYTCEIRRSPRSAGGCGRRLVCYTKWAGRLLRDASKERCPSHYIHIKCRNRLDFGLKDECVDH